MNPLPPHFWVWLLAMTTNGHTDHLAGFNTERACVEAVAGMNQHANRAVRFSCERFAITKE